MVRMPGRLLDKNGRLLYEEGCGGNGGALIEVETTYLDGGRRVTLQEEVSLTMTGLTPAGESQLTRVVEFKLRRRDELIVALKIKTVTPYVGNPHFGRGTASK